MVISHSTENEVIVFSSLHAIPRTYLRSTRTSLRGYAGRIVT